MSYTLFSLIKRKAKKPHRCIWCGQTIDIGNTYLDERSVYEGNIQRHRWHPECNDRPEGHFKDEDTFDPYEMRRPILAQAGEVKGTP